MPRRKSVRTIEIRRRLTQAAGSFGCREQWDVLIPLQFCTKREAVTYARQMARAGNQLNPKVRTIVRVLR